MSFLISVLTKEPTLDISSIGKYEINMIRWVIGD